MILATDQTKHLIYIREFAYGWASARDAVCKHNGFGEEYRKKLNTLSEFEDRLYKLCIAATQKDNLESG